MSKSGKGSQFERDICRELSLWWSDGERDDIFWRTSGSGARATTRRRQEKKTAYEAGDVGFRCPTGKLFVDYFLLELKRGYSAGISVLDLIDKGTGKKPLLLQWQEKVEKEKEFTQRSWTLIIFRRNSRRTCMLMDLKLYNLFQDQCGDFFSDVIFINRVTFQWVIISLADFFNWISAATIKELARESNLIKEVRNKQASHLIR